MKIVVLGSGLMGVTSAYELAKRGFDVTVIDRQSESGRECSYANGGQLSYSEGEPWATPTMLKKLPGWMLRLDAPLVFRFRADREMIRWGISFCATVRRPAPSSIPPTCSGWLFTVNRNLQQFATIPASRSILPVAASFTSMARRKNSTTAKNKTCSRQNSAASKRSSRASNASSWNRAGAQPLRDCRRYPFGHGRNGRRLPLL